MLLSSEFTKCGIYSGPHSEYQHMNVIDFAIGYRSKKLISNKLEAPRPEFYKEEVIPEGVISTNKTVRSTVTGQTRVTETEV